MIPIAKGKFSQPRQPRQEETPKPKRRPQSADAPRKPRAADPSLEETILLNTDFEDFLTTPADNAAVPDETLTFEEALFREETAPGPAITDEPQVEEEDYYEKPRKKTSNAARRNQKNRRILLVAICVVAVLLLITLIAGLVIHMRSNKDDGLILNNVTVAGVNIGGMTPEEAASAIHRATDMTFSVENMVIYLPDTILELAPKDTRAYLDVNAAVEAAYNYGRTGTSEEIKQAQANSLVSNHTIALLPYLTLDLAYIREQLDNYGEYFNSDYQESSWTLEGPVPELAGSKFDDTATPQMLVLNPGKPGRYVDIDKIYNAVLDAYSMNIFEVRTDMSGEEQTPALLDLDALFDEICTESVDAAMDMTTFEVTEETYGYTFDLDRAKELLSQTEYGTTVSIPMEFVVPNVLSKDLDGKLFRDVLASVETRHTNDENRNTNLRLACKAINGMILMPGDTFDYNKALGERTEAKGYKPAGALSAGNSLTEVGGGICQVSSTLYYATLLSDLEIVTRRSHSLPSSYMPMMGIDATVSWGGPDFRFRNNTEYPIRIEAEVSGGYVKIKLLGTDDKDYYVKMEVKVVEILNPNTVEETYTAAEAKQKGYKDGQVKEPGATGYTVYSYRCKYDKETNQLISKDFEATSNYVRKDKIVIVVLPEETEPPTEPTPTDPPAPTDPAPTDPAPTDPAPTDPAPTNPPAAANPPAPPAEGGETE